MKDSIEEKEKEVSSYRTKFTSLDIKNGELEDEIEKLQDQLKTMESEKGNFAKDFEELELNKDEELRQADAIIEKLREEIADLHNDISAERKQTEFMKS